MLGGKHFRRRQQRALVAGVDHLQHRQHRDDGLARAHLALQHPVHGPARRPVRPTARRARRVCPSVSSNGNCRSSAAASPSSRGGAGGPDSLSSPYRRATSAHCSPTASSKVRRSRAPLALGSRSRRDGSPRSASSSEIRFRCRRIDSGSGSVDRVEHGEHLAHARVDVPALHLGAGRIDRKELPLERRQQLVSPVAPEASAIVLQRFGARLSCRWATAGSGTPDGSAALRP